MAKFAVIIAMVLAMAILAAGWADTGHICTAEVCASLSLPILPVRDSSFIVES